MTSFEKALTAKPDVSGVSGHMVGETGANAGNSLAVAGGTLGLECNHHYGITTHDLRNGMTAGELTYWLIRNAWHTAALTDDNHTWEIVDTEAPGWSYVRIIKNAKSPRFLLCPMWYPDGPGQTWFTQEFRVATITNIAWEVAGHLAAADRWDADAAKQKDTIKGRKNRSRYTGYAKTERRLAELVRSRWPAVYQLERTAWQKRMHEHRTTPEQSS